MTLKGEDWAEDGAEVVEGLGICGRRIFCLIFCLRGNGHEEEEEEEEG